MLLHFVLGFFLSVTTEQTALDRVTHSVLGSCLQVFTGNFWHFSFGTSSQTWLSLHCLTGTSLHTV